MQRVFFVKVLGFSDAERHALDTLLRLSRERDTGYAPWGPESGVAARMALVDGASGEAAAAFQSSANRDLEVIWIGPGAPAAAWRSFARPIQWPEVIAAMDQFLLPPPELDFDLGEPGEAQDTLPPGPAAPVRRALIASADRDERLYLRARLSLAGLTLADEAESAGQALELAGLNRYEVALVDFALPGRRGWELEQELRRTEPGIANVIVTKDRLSPAERVRALWRRQPVLLARPLHPLRLKALLERL